MVANVMKQANEAAAKLKQGWVESSDAFKKRVEAEKERVLLEHAHKQVKLAEKHKQHVKEIQAAADAKDTHFRAKAHGQKTAKHFDALFGVAEHKLGASYPKTRDVIELEQRSEKAPKKWTGSIRHDNEIVTKKPDGANLGSRQREDVVALHEAMKAEHANKIGVRDKLFSHQDVERLNKIKEARKAAEVAVKATVAPVEQKVEVKNQPFWAKDLARVAAVKKAKEEAKNTPAAAPALKV